MKESFKAPNGWYKKSSVINNIIGGQLDDKKLLKYVLKGHYGEIRRREAQAALDEERRRKRALNAK